MIALLLALALASPAASHGGLRGEVTRGPITPVCRVGTPCSAPAAGLVLVFRANGHAARTTTDAAGRYRIALAPGTWSVAPAGATRIGNRIAPAQARVVAGVFRRVDFSIDTGIR